jgi:hypothetical protein
VRLQFSHGLSDGRGLLVCFSMGFIARLIPELLAFRYPIGFDTVDYALIMKRGVIWPHWSTIFTSSWLLYAVTVPLYGIVGGDPFSLLKILGPVLFGLNVAGVYWFARRELSWGAVLSLVAGGFFVFQLASLRISWDLLRNTLGMAALLFALPFVNKLSSKRGVVIFVVLSLLTVFAHEYSAVALVTVVLGLVVWRLVKRVAVSDAKRLFLAFIPALSVFLTSICLRIFPIAYTVETNVIGASDVVDPHPGGLFFLVDYLHVRSAVDYYGVYWSLALNVLVLFGLLYLPYLFLVLKGFFRNAVLDLWTGLLLVGSFGCLILPFCAVEYWHRWLFMLVYPLVFYSVKGLSKMLRMFDGGRVKFKVEKRAAGMVLLTASLGVAYLFTPLSMINTGASVVSVLPYTRTYFSTNPGVPYQDVDGVIQAMRWLEDNLNTSSCVVLQTAFLSWGELYLDNSHAIMHFETDLDLAVNATFKYGFSHVFFVWWNQPIGWYGISVPDYFVRVHDFGRISVYEYGSV